MKKTNRVLTVVLVAAMVVASVLVYCGAAELTYGAAIMSGDGNDVQEVLLEYGDYYTFGDALYVRKPESGAVSASGKTIHAENVTDEPVEIEVIDRRFRVRKYAVKVRKAKLQFVLIDGQSNAAGFSGILDREPPCPKGVAFAWKDGRVVDLKDSHQKHYHTVGFHPAIAGEWYALTGEKTMFLNVARSGMPVGSWFSERYAQQTVDMIGEVLSAVDPSKFELVGTGYYWLQGESDSGADTDRYQFDLDRIHKMYIDALTRPGISAPYGGIMTVRSLRELVGYNPSFVSEYNGPRAAQQALANKYSDLFMASVVTDTWDRNSKSPYSFTSDAGITISGDDTSMLFNGIHFNQSAYDIMGLEAADSIYKGHILGDAATDFSLKGYDAVQIYPEGSVIYAEDNEWYDTRGTDRNPVQLVVTPEPFYGRCEGVTMKVTDSSGRTQTGITDSSGWISDYTKITEPLKLIVTVNGNSKKYVLTRKDLPEADIELDHELEYRALKKATIKKEGCIEHWQCGRCGKLFIDDKGAEEIGADKAVIAKNNMTVKAKTITARAAKKTTFKAADAFTVKNAKGKLSYKKTSGETKITISSAGRVTVRKSLKSGKMYKVKVKVTSAETARYAAVTKAVTLSVKVK